MNSKRIGVIVAIGLILGYFFGLRPALRKSNCEKAFAFAKENSMPLLDVSAVMIDMMKGVDLSKETQELLPAFVKARFDIQRAFNGEENLLSDIERNIFQIQKVGELFLQNPENFKVRAEIKKATIPFEEIKKLWSNAVTKVPSNWGLSQCTK